MTLEELAKNITITKDNKPFANEYRYTASITFNRQTSIPKELIHENRIEAEELIEEQLKEGLVDFVRTIMREIENEEKANYCCPNYGANEVEE